MGNGYERRGQEFADTLHERSRDSAFEYRKLLTSLSTGSLALFFLALTTEVRPPLTEIQVATLSIAVLCMATATFSGLYCWHADATRNYFWARVEEGKQRSGGPEFDTLAKTWKRRLERATTALKYAFAAGIASSVAYILQRVTEL